MICNAFQERLNPLYKCVSFLNFVVVIKSLLQADRKILFHTFLKTFLLPRKCLNSAFVVQILGT